MSETGSLTGKHALVTGGGTGIGLAIAEALAAEGAEVTITGRRADVLEKVAGGRLHAQQMDVADEASVVDGTAAAVAARGPVQICVANAGIAEGKTLQKTDLDFWRKVMAINLDGAFLTIRESMRSMSETDWGRVIAVSSIAGLHGLKGAGAYSASKHGVLGLIRTYSEEYLGTGFTFNSLCPGYVETDIVRQQAVSIAERTGQSVEDARGYMASANRHKTLIQPEEVAAAALWLCRPGSESVNGIEVPIAGGKI